MKSRILGSSGIEVSEIGLGCMSLRPDNAKDIIHCALDRGITIFDTADLYDLGNNERVVGAALKEVRSDVKIATKVGNKMLPDGGWEWTPDPEYIRVAVEQSLQRLDTDYIDVYMLHGGVIGDPFDDIISLMENLVQEGKILSFGISSVRPNVIKQISATSMNCLMTQYSLLDRRPEESTLTICEENDIGILVRGSIAKGLLSSKASAPYLGQSRQHVRQVRGVIDAMARKAELRSGVAMHYVLQNKAVSSVLIGASSKSQLEENLKSYESVKELEIDYALLSEVIPSFKYENHRV